MGTDRWAVVLIAGAILFSNGCAVGLRKSAAIGIRLASAEEPVQSEAQEERAEEEPAVTLGGVVAGWYHGLRERWQHFKAWYVHTYHTTARWPEPHIGFARRAFYDHWDAQATAARKYRYGLFSHHFDPGTGRLNALGKRRLDQILRQLEGDEAYIYVQAAASRAETEDRIAAVRAALERHTLGREDLAIITIPASPATVTGEEAVKEAKELVESVGRFPRWMDRNVRMQRSNSGAGRY